MRSNAAVFRGGHGALTVDPADVSGVRHGALHALNARSVLVFD